MPGISLEGSRPTNSNRLPILHAVPRLQYHVPLTINCVHPSADFDSSIMLAQQVVASVEMLLYTWFARFVTAGGYSQKRLAHPFMTPDLKFLAGYGLAVSNTPQHAVSLNPHLMFTCMPSLR